jgi:hypothetical protein
MKYEITCRTTRPGHGTYAFEFGAKFELDELDDIVRGDLPQALDELDTSLDDEVAQLERLPGLTWRFVCADGTVLEWTAEPIRQEPANDR